MLTTEPTVAMAATTTKIESKIGRNTFSLPAACHITQESICNKEFHTRERRLRVLSSV